MKYKVRWKGYDPSEDTWEPEENLLTCKSLVEEYITRRVSAELLMLLDFSDERGPSQSSGVWV